MDMIHTESHFNFVKMHLLSHFSDHIRQFGNIPMYSTEFGELAHKEQIKDGWRHSNKNDVERQILHSYRRQPAIQMRLLNLNSLRRRGANLCDAASAKKVILRPISPRSPCAPDVPGAYNVNSSSGCVRPGSFRPEVKGPPPIRPDATGSVWMHWTRPFCVQTP